MFKKVTIGFAVATAAFFILSIATLPFAIKKQMEAFAGEIVVNDDSRENNIEVTNQKYHFVFKDRTSVRIEESYDNKIHVDFDRITLGTPTVTVEEKEDKAIVYVKNQIDQIKNKLLMFIDSCQDCTIYVPTDVEIDISGDFHIRHCDENINYPDYIEEQNLENDYSDSLENYEFYKTEAMVNDSDVDEAKIRKLIYAGSLMAKDYAQGDITKPMYIDFMVLVKKDISNTATDYFNMKNSNLYDKANIDAIIYSGIGYVEKQFDLVYSEEILRIEKSNYTDEEIQETTSESSISQTDDGKLAITQIEQGDVSANNKSELYELNQDVKDKKIKVDKYVKEFIKILGEYFNLESEADYIVDTFTV